MNVLGMTQIASIHQFSNLFTYPKKYKRTRKVVLVGLAGGGGQHKLHGGLSFSNSADASSLSSLQERERKIRGNSRSQIAMGGGGGGEERIEALFQLVLKISLFGSRL